MAKRKCLSHSIPSKGAVELILVTMLPGVNVNSEVHEPWVAQKYRVIVGNQSSYEVSPMLNEVNKLRAFCAFCAGRSKAALVFEALNVT